jgi:hypothetical protein
LLLSLLGPRFDPAALALNLVAIAIGLLMGRAVARFLFSPPSPTK